MSSDDRLSNRVLNAVAARQSTAPEQLPPLFEAIDPDALDVLFLARANGAPREEGMVQFTYAGCRVTVSSSGDVTVD